MHDPPGTFSGLHVSFKWLIELGRSYPLLILRGSLGFDWRGLVWEGGGVASRRQCERGAPWTSTLC